MANKRRKILPDSITSETVLRNILGFLRTKVLPCPTKGGHGLSVYYNPASRTQSDNKKGNVPPGSAYGNYPSRPMGPNKVKTTTGYKSSTLGTEKNCSLDQEILL